MVRIPLDITGRRFGKLFAIEFAGKKKKVSYWLVGCDCGNIKKVQKNRLMNGSTTSCGCDFRLPTRNGKSLYRSQEYLAWNNMMSRCTNPKNSYYHMFGGRGIGVEQDWDNFANFYRDMGDKPEGTTLGRIDPDKGYTKENTRWQTAEQRKKNFSWSKRIEYNGKIYGIVKLCRLLHSSPETIYKKLELGIPLDQRLPVQSKVVQKDISSYSLTGNRVEDIINLKDMFGCSFRQIGEVFGIKRQRAHQIYQLNKFFQDNAKNRTGR